MTPEDKLLLEKRMEALANRCAALYPQEKIGDQVWYITPSGEVFSFISLPDWGAILAEYAENKATAVYDSEDGDLLYLDNMTEDEMLAAILAELEQE